MLFDEGADILFELARGGVDAALELLAGEFGEPALDLIDPGCLGRCEVGMIVRPPREP